MPLSLLPIVGSSSQFTSDRGNMINYTKLAILLLRTLGLIMLMYSGPMLVWGVLKAAAGGRTASDGVTSLQSAIFAWGVYALAGFFLFILARPLASIAARGLEDSPMR